jgi:predicted XRE-type DNA-binding protein
MDIHGYVQARKVADQLANQLGVTQNRISKFERIDLERAELQTIRSYIHALGGKLKLVVELDEIEYPLA